MFPCFQSFVQGWEDYSTGVSGQLKKSSLNVDVYLGVFTGNMDMSEWSARTIAISIKDCTWENGTKERGRDYTSTIV